MNELLSKLETTLRAEAKKKYELELIAIERKLLETSIRIGQSESYEGNSDKTSKTELEKFIDEHREHLTAYDLEILQQPDMTPKEIAEMWDKAPSESEIRRRLNGTSKSGIKYQPGRLDVPGKRSVCTMSFVMAMLQQKLMAGNDT